MRPFLLRSPELWLSGAAMPDDLSDLIETAVEAPQSVTVAGGNVASRPIPELIEADKYLAAKRARTKNHCGLIFRTLEPGGCG